MLDGHLGSLNPTPKASHPTPVELPVELRQNRLEATSRSTHWSRKNHNERQDSGRVLFRQDKGRAGAPCGPLQRLMAPYKPWNRTTNSLLL